MDENKKPTWMDIIRNRGTATYRNGKIDFSNGEGGNNHIYVYNGDGAEIGYIWFDTHCDYYGFCGKLKHYCNGIFATILEEDFPTEWHRSDLLFRFTELSFAAMMVQVIDRIR